MVNNGKAAIDKIHEFERFGSVLGLERMNVLLEKLGNPQDDLKVIHVAGTNGKGSTCKYIYSALKENGYKVGLYISPFLEVFNERIEFDGAYISDEDLAIYTERVLKCVEEMVNEGLDSPTEFEVVTAVAFLYFKEKQSDYVVLEVGLGGKGDSTNVCKEPLVSVIASISFDHTDRLGNTIEEIAAEKAGIIKEGCPVVTSCENQAALRVIEKTAESLGAMYFETRHIPYKIEEQSLFGYRFSTTIQGVPYENIEISMSGEHQIKNAIAALATLCILEENGKVVLKNDAIYEGFKKAKQIGRFELLSKENSLPMVIIDGAHNPDGAEALAKAMKDFCSDKKILMVTGMLADKDTDSIIEKFVDITKDFIITEPDNPRKMSCDALAEKFNKKGANTVAIENNYDACMFAKEKSKDYDVVLFAGSLYMIGGMRGIINREWV